MYQVSVATLTKLATPYWAMVLAPEAPDPPSNKVTPPAGLTVVELLAIINTAVPMVKFVVPLVGIVSVPDP